MQPLLVLRRAAVGAVIEIPVLEHAFRHPEPAPRRELSGEHFIHRTEPPDRETLKENVEDGPPRAGETMTSIGR